MPGDTKLTLRVTEDFLWRLKAKAVEERTTLTELVLRVLTEYLEADA